MTRNPDDGAFKSSIPRRGGALLCCVLLAVGCLVGVAGCRYSDYFTETIIDQRSSQEGQVDPIVINSLTAKQRSDKLSARRWDDDSEQTSAKENIVVYGSKPNDTHETPHSVFSTSLKAWSFEASDPVKLIYSENAELDHKVEIDKDEKTPAKDTESKTSGGVKSKKENSDQESVAQEQKGSQDDSSKNTSETKVKKGDKNPSSEKSDVDDESNGSSNDSGEGDSSGDGSGGGSSASGDGSGDNGSGGNGGSGSSDSEDKGDDEEDAGGYDGSDIIYDSNNIRSSLNHVNCVAALGQAAVVAQAIGGKGAICAMDQATYYGLNSDSIDLWQAGSFKEVFSEELKQGFEKDALLWSGNGLKPQSLGNNLNKLIELCTENGSQPGVIFYDDHEAKANERFSGSQLKKFKKAGIQLVPIDLTTAAGAQAAVKAIGEILSESDCRVGGKTSTEMANIFSASYKNIINGVLNTHGGNFALTGVKGVVHNQITGFKTATFQDYGIKSLICQDYAGTVVYASNDESFDMSNGLFFSYDNMDSWVSSLWLQVAGVYEDNSGTNCTGEELKIVWGRNPSDYSKYLFSGYTSAAFSKLGESSFNSKASNAKLLDVGASNENGIGQSYWFGGRTFPYVIVCGSSDYKYTGAEVKKAFVSSIELQGTPYSWRKTAENESCVGQDGPDNAFERGVSAEESVIVNPVGLLGSWHNISSGLESVLECVWLAQVYSKAPAKSKYDPSVIYGSDGISDLSVNIDGKTYTTPHEVISAFYKTFYRYDIDSSRAKADGCSYSDIVPDEGVEE